MFRNRTTIMILSLVSTLLCGAGLASAQTDEIGIYTTDDGADDTVLYTSAPFEQIQAYVMLRQPSLGGVSGWECEILIEGEENVDYVAPYWTYAGDGLNVGNPVLGEFHVGVGIGGLALRPGPSGDILLATFNCYVPDIGRSFDLVIGPYPESVSFPDDGGPGYVHPDDIDILQPLLVAQTPALSVNHVPAVTAAFTAEPDTGFAPLPVAFTSTSLGSIDTYLWYFGNGSTSSERNPEHVYADPGQYTVRLDVTGEHGSDYVVQEVIVDDPTVTADFTFGYYNHTAPARVHFRDQSDGQILEYHWDLGDGHFAYQAEFIHTYQEPGQYEVTLTVTGPLNSDTTSRPLTIGDDSVIADFSFEPESPYAHETVQFTDESTGSLVGWLWMFGDGSISTLRNPTHAYAEPGTYAVMLHAQSATQSDYTTREIVVRDATVVPSFTFDPQVGDAPLEVHFQDTSTGMILSRQWNFGDGTHSTLTEPAHIYNVPGTYVVTLTVVGYGGPVSTTDTVIVTGTAADPIVLSWSDEPGYVDDGVDPDSGDFSTNFEFRVVYSQAQGYAPATGFPRLQLDANGDGDFLDPGEGQYAMFPADGNVDYVAGREYRRVVNLSQGSQYRHRFTAQSDEAPLACIGEPTEWTEGPTVVASDVPDLYVTTHTISIFPEMYDIPGEPLIIMCPVFNRGGLAATAVLRITCDDMSGGPYQIGNFPLEVPAADGEPGTSWVQTLWTVPGIDTVFHFDVTDVLPTDADPSNNHASYYYNDSPVPVEADDGPQPEAVPEALTLSPNYPNPFNPSTSFELALPRPEHVSVGVYDLKGRLVRMLVDGYVGAGRHTLTWDGNDGAGVEAAGGVYVCRLVSGTMSRAMKITLLK